MATLSQTIAEEQQSIQTTPPPPARPATIPADFPATLGGVDVFAEAEKDVQEQKGITDEFTLESLAKKFEGLMALRDKPQLTQTDIDTYVSTKMNGVAEIGGVEITPKFLSFSKDPKNEERYYSAFISENLTTKAPGLALAFSSPGPEFEEVRLPAAFDTVSPKFKNRMTQIVQDSQDTARIISNVFSEGKSTSIPLQGQEVLLNKIANGDFYTEFKKTMAGIFPETARGIVDFPAMIYQGGKAVFKKVIGETRDLLSGSEEFDKSITEMFDEGMQAYTFSSPRTLYEAGLNSTKLFEDAYVTMNKFYKDAFYAQYSNREDADKAWFTAHKDYFRQFPELEVVTAEDGTQTLKQVVNEDGEPQYQEYQLPQDTVRQLLDLAFNKLPSHEQGILHFMEMAPITYTFTAAHLHKMGRYKKVVERGRNRKRQNDIGEEVPEYSPSLTDIEVFNAERKRALLGFQRPFSKAWNALTLQSAKSMLKRQSVFDMHVDTLRRYDDDIAKTTDDIQEIKAQISTGKTLEGVPLDPTDISTLKEKLSNAQSSLKFLQDGKSRYKLTMGSSTKFYGDTPFMRQLIADDTMIAGAIAYSKVLLSSTYDVGGEQISFMSSEAAEAVSAIMAPLLAPMLIRGTVGLGVRFSDKISNVPTASANTLDFIGSKLHLIPPDVVRSGNVGDMKAVLERNGMRPNDDTIKAFQVLNKLFTAMPAEYRERAYQGLLRYNRTMGELRSEMKMLKLEDSVIEQNMSTLSLSLAKATGLAPLVAAQGAEVSRLKVRDLTKGSKVEQVLDTMKSEEDVIAGMELNIKMFIDSVESEAGIKIQSNETLRHAMGTLTGMVVAQRDNLFARKAALKLHVDKLYKYVADPDENATIDQGTVDRLVQLEEGLLPPGTVVTQVERAKIQMDVRKKLIASVKDQADAVAAFHGKMTSREVNKRMNELTEKIFNITEGGRISEASLGYKQLDNLKDKDGNPLLIDLSDVTRNISQQIDSFQDKPISYAYKGGKKFLSQGGTELNRTLNKTGLRGMLQSGFSMADLRAILRQRRKQTGNDSFSFGDLALELQETSAKTGNPQNYFLATPSEVASIERHFRNVGRSQTSSDFAASELSRNIETAVSNTLRKYSFVDERSGVSKTLKEGYDEASVQYRKVRGEPTSAGTYGNIVRSNKTYNEVLNPTDSGHAGKYKNDAKTPRYIYDEIEQLMAKAIAPTTSGPEFNEIKQQIRNKRDKLLEFVGGSVGPDGQMGLDFRKADHIQIAELLQTVFNISGSTAFSGKLFKELEEQAVKKAPAYLKLDVKEPEKKYNFEVYDRINQIEQEMKIPVISKTGRSTSDLHLLSVGEVGEFAKDFDRLLEDSVLVQTEFKQIRNELLDTTSVVRIGAEKELAIEQDLLTRARQLEGLPKNPLKFGEEFFDTKTPEEFEEIVLDFVERSKLTKNPMTEQEVRAFMKYQYMRMLMEKSGLRFKYTTRTEDRKGIAEVSDVRVLIDHVADEDGKRAMMEAVLGKRHTEHMDAIADWATFATGDALSIKNMDMDKLMSLESAFSRAFNIARGMVSPLYVGTEVSTRLIMHRNESLIKMALSDREAAGIMAKVLSNPAGGISSEDIKTLGLRLRNYIAKDLIVSGGTLPTVDQVISGSTGNVYPMIEAPKEKIQERDPNEQLFRAVAGE